MKHLNYLKQLSLTVSLLLASAVMALAAPLNGTYTIGGASPNYASLQAAITDLNAQGVNGPVVFNIRAGSYSGTTAQGAINAIAGASATNTITFQAESGPGTVTLSPTANSDNTNGVFILNGANWIIIKDLTLSNTGTTYGADVQYRLGASNNTVQNCILTGNTSTSTTQYKSRIYAYSTAQSFNGTGNKVLGCTFPAGCSYGVYVWSQGSGSGQRASDFEVSGCTMTPYSGGLYAYYVDDMKFNNNTVTKNTAGSSTFYMLYYYDCDSNMQIMGNNLQIPTNGTTTYGIYRYYCDGSANKRQAITGNTMNFTCTSIMYWWYNYYNQWDSIEANNITAISTGSANYGYNYYANYWTLKNNTLNISSNVSTCYVFYNDGSGYGLNHRIMNNTINGSSSGGGTPYFINYYLTNSICTNNTISLTSATGSAYNYWRYGQNNIYAYNDCKSTSGGGGTVYGLYTGANGSTFGGNRTYNNKIVAKTNTGSYYGLYYYYANGDTFYNNAISAIQASPSATGTGYAMMVYYPYFDSKFYNNTLNDFGQGFGTHYTLYTYYGYNGANVTFTNNIFNRANATPGYFMYVYDPPTYGFGGSTWKYDYNNMYAPSTVTWAYNAYSGGTLPNYPAWRTSTLQNRNGLSYPAAFVSAVNGDVTPDASNSNCWGMNGRGIHIAGNSVDLNNNPRHTITSTGVPDLGCYEFTPNSGVLPPVIPGCTNCAVAGALAAGSTQYYTFGYDTVASITWDAAATVPSTQPTCQQYSGAAPVGLTSLNPTNMYFYTDILSSTNADYVANIYYKDPWIGTIATEQALHLAKKDGSNPWVGYALPGSAANTVANYIYSPSSPKLNTYGSYTGIDVPNNAGVVGIVEPSGAFCPGVYTVKVKIRNGGNNVINSVKIDWELDFVAQPQISYNTPIPVNNGTPGINEVTITLGNINFGVAARTFKVWTSLPNNTTDPIPADDTLGPIQMRAALSGDYTVGGTTPDFPNLVTATNALKSAGMCGPVRFLMRAGTYVGNIDLTNVAGSSAVNRLTIMNDVGVPASAINVTYGATGTGDNYVIRLNGMQYTSIKNISIAATGVSYGYGIVINGTSADDTVSGCIITCTNNSTSTNYAGIYTNGGTPRNFKILNNTITACVGMYLYCGTSNTPGLEIIGNSISSYYMGTYYVYYFNGPKIKYNTITNPVPNSSSAGYYGMYYVYCSGNTLPVEFVGNKVYNYMYGVMYLYYPGNSATQRSLVANNVITFSASNTGYYGLYCYYPNRTTFAHNTFSLAGASYTSGYAAFIYQYTYTADSIYNNIFANYEGGYALYSYMYPGYQHNNDYNNFYTSGSTLVYDAYVGGMANMASWRSSSVATSANADRNSISYDPGIDKATGIPDVTNANAWTIHGRGKQNSIVTTDINGTPRPTTLAAGVPDLGAYEFDGPTVAPPNAVPSPTVPAPGITQTFTLGYTNIATVQWNTQLALTSPLSVKQYSGVVAPYNFMTVSQNKYPYFYTDITPTGLGSTFDFNLTANYYDTWLGTIPSEANMKLAHKYTSVPYWISYNAANSSTSTTNNTIYAAGVTGFGTFTGIDDNVNFSANVKVVGSVVMCTGRSVTLNASPVSGGSTTYTYQWRRNGVDISGANGASFVATSGGDYTVLITATSVFPNISAESIPVSVTVVSPPMALITANGPLTYCIGSGLTLTASSGGTTYQWQLNGSNLGTSTTQGVTGAGVYRVIVSNIGCKDTSDNMIINAGPIAVNLGSDVTGCEIKGVPYILDAGYPGAKYLWSTGDTTQTIKVYKGSGSYSVTVDAGPNCTGSDVVAVTLDPLPTVAGISYLRTGNKYVFSAAGVQNVNSYFWMFSDGTTSTSPSVTKTFDGTMTAKLIVKNDCGNDTINMVNWGTGVSGVVGHELEANVYPNPANDVVTFAVKGASMKDITILNALGEVVYRAEVGGAGTEASINVSAFAAGRYIIRSSTTEGIISKPFNIQR